MSFEFLYPSDWIVLAKIALAAVAMYAIVILSIRISGKRTTSQMNNFDWVVTVAMGTVVASTILQNGVPLLNGVAALAALLTLQWTVTKLSFHVPAISALFRATPRILLWEGEFLRDQMRKERVSRSEVLAAIRESGIEKVQEVAAVILETDASLSVVPKSAGDVHRDDSSFQDVTPDVETLKRAVRRSEARTA